MRQVAHPVRVVARYGRQADNAHMTKPDPRSGGPPGSAGYTPMVSQEHAERIRRWHENAYRAMKAEAGSGQTFAYLGMRGQDADLLRHLRRPGVPEKTGRRRGFQPGDGGSGAAGQGGLAGRLLHVPVDPVALAWR